MVFPEERNKAVLQVQLANLYVEVLQNECIQHGIIKEAPVKVAVALAKNSLRIWEKVKGKAAQEQKWEVGRQMADRHRYKTKWCRIKKNVTTTHVKKPTPGKQNHGNGSGLPHKRG